MDRETSMSHPEQRPEQPLVEYFFIIAFSYRENDAETFSGTFTPTPGMTRYDVYNRIHADHLQRMPSLIRSGCKVTFFSLEPNRLG